MLWRTGFILNSLKYQVEKQLHDWRKNNDVLRTSRWSLFERSILICSSHPVKTALTILFIMLLLAYGATYFHTTIFEYLPNSKRHIWVHLNEWDSTIMASSLAVITLIVPLALGFVGNDIKSSSSRDAFWDIYIKYAAPKLLVSSSLFLIFFSLSTQFFEPFIEPKFRASLSGAAIMWMIVNAILMGWFFFATFKLVSVKSRNYLTKRYFVNEELIAEIEYRLSRLLPQVAGEHKLIPAFNKSKEDNETLKVTTFSLYDENKMTYEIMYKDSRYVKNIYYRILSLALYSVYLKLLIVDVFNVFRGQPSKNIGKRELSLPLNGGDIATKKVRLYESVSFNVSFLSRLIIRCAYSFKKGRGRKESNFKFLISMLSGQVRDALKEENYQQYVLAIETLEQFTNELIDCSHFINDDGFPDNWLLLAGGGFFSNKLFWVIAKEFHELTNESLQLINKSTKYIERMLWTQKRVFGYRESNLAEDVTRELLLTHYRQWMALTEWKSKFDSQGESKVLDNNYKTILRTYVSTWESWPSGYRRIEKVEWKNAVLVSKFYMDHLNNTACMLINSLRNKDIDSASWAADMLIHWIDNAYLGRSPHRFDWRSDFFTVDELGKDDEDESLSFSINGELLSEISDENKTKQYADALKIALLNYWCDVIILTSAYILQRPKDDISEHATRLAISLVDEKRQYPSGGVDIKYLTLNRGANFVSILFRQHWLKNWPTSDYTKKLDGLISRFNSLNETPKVSGRIYSGWGGEGIENLRKGIKAIFLYKTQGQGQISRALEDFIIERTSFEHRATIQSDIAKFIEINSEELVNNIGIDDYDERNNNLKVSFENISNFIGEHNRKDLAQAEVDPNREKELSQFASRDAFDLNAAPFPINQFSAIVEADRNELEQYTYTYTNYRKSDVANGIDAVKIANEDDWLASTISDDLSSNIMGKFWNTLKDIQYDEYGDWLTILRKIKIVIHEYEDSRRNQLLIVNQWGLQWYLDKLIWGYDEDIPHSEFDCRKEDGMPESYLCHFEDIEVHSGPFKDIPNILTTKEKFASLKAGKSDDGECVQAKYEPDEDSENDNIGKLVLSYWIVPDFTDEKVLLFKGPENEDD